MSRSLSAASSLAAVSLAAVLAAFFMVVGCAPSAETTTSSADTTAIGDTSSVPRTVSRTGRSSPEQSLRGRQVRLDTVEARRFDQGKMWTFESPPVEYFQEEYGFSPEEEWFERARLGALRIPGCTASFVSPRGLMLTNHHCGREHAAEVSRPGEALLENGFYAETMDQERRVDGLYADQLIAIEDVTDEVEQALAQAQTDAERAEARRQAFDRIADRLEREAGGGEEIHEEFASLYDGGRYSAYTYRRYDDVRLVMIPEVDAGYFGGDPDNFTYPRYTFDVSFFRVYDDQGRPLQPESYFPLSAEGAGAGAPVFVVGNPGSTSRLETVAQLAYRRDVSDRALLELLETRVDALQAYAQANPSADVENRIFGLKNGIKLYRGRLRTLRDPVILARRRDAQQKFQKAIAADPELDRPYGGLIDSMAALQQQKRQWADAYRAFLLLESPTLSSATLRRALLAYRYLSRREAGADAEAVSDLRQQLLEVEDEPPGINRRFLRVRLQSVRQHLGDSLVQAVLQGRTPEAAAREIVEGSALRTAESTQAALDEGSLRSDDPAVEVIAALYPRYRDYQSAMSGLNARQEEIARRLGRARYAVYGTEVPPDATFTLRLADGRVRGYPYNGTLAPPHTTFSGMYDHYHAYRDPPWDLPRRWLERLGALDLAVPLNLVSTNDITGGNSGSPLLNRDLELVGIVFDGNIESLAGDFIYLPGRARAISVDARGILEALGAVYEADRLVEELQGARQQVGASR